MNNRDELAKVIVTAYGEDADVECPCEQDLEVADAILAAGYSRPRTVSTVEELDALPDGSIIMDGMVRCREGLRTMGSGNVWRAMGPAKVLRSNEIALPASVLYEPEGK